MRGLKTWTLAAAVMVAMALGARAADEKKPDAPKAEAVDFRKLKELLPEEAGGIKRLEASGEKNKIGEMSVSSARAEYKKKDDDSDKAPRVEITFTDYGGVEMAAGIAAAWTALEIDKETDNGYEKTVKVGEGKHPGYEQWNKEDKHGSLQLMVGKRIIVQINTDNLPAEQLKKIAEALPLAKLAELK